ncbi:MAG TPA: hypothetical protein VNM41_04810, partial [Solirubrobacterales bacterium]|nr:hypothetical protein [Solirubrobacterales bacterium]
MQLPSGPNRLSGALALAICLALPSSAAAAAVPAQGESAKLSPPLAELAAPGLADSPPAAQDRRLG